MCRKYYCEWVKIANFFRGTECKKVLQILAILPRNREDKNAAPFDQIGTEAYELP
jgi:hypothetical protein